MRREIDYNPRVETPNVSAQPNISVANQRLDIGKTPALQLAEALGVGGKVLENEAQRRATDEQMQARAYANSLTLDELGKRLTDGSLLPSQSPVFVGALQHIYGDNLREKVKRDIDSKIMSGELQFNTPEELEEYMTNVRNDNLTGQSDYAIAGFDKKWEEIRNSATNAWQTKVSRDLVERGTQEASEYLIGVIRSVSGSDADEETKKAAVGRTLDFLRATGVTRLPEASKQVIASTMETLANEGMVADYDRLVSMQLPNNGPTVASLLGNEKAAALRLRAEARFDQRKREELVVPIRDFEMDADQGELDAIDATRFAGENQTWLPAGWLPSILRQNEAALARMGRDAAKMRMDQMMVEYDSNTDALIREYVRTNTLPEAAVNTFTKLTKDGEEKPLSDTELRQRTEAAALDISRDLPFDQQVEMFARNNITHTQWQNSLKAGVAGLSSWLTNMKPGDTGQVPEQVASRLQMFTEINTRNPSYAQALLSDSEYRVLNTYQQLAKSMGADEAARIATLGYVRPPDRDTDEKIRSANFGKVVEDKLLSVPWYRDVATLVGLDSAQDVTGNTQAVKAEAMFLAEALLRSRSVSTAEEAASRAVELLKESYVPVGPMLYHKKDLPTFPSGADANEYMQDFAKWFASGTPYGDQGNLLRIVPTGTGLYSVQTSTGGFVDLSQPYVTRAQIEEWGRTNRQRKVNESLSEVETPQQAGQLPQHWIEKDREYVRKRKEEVAKDRKALAEKFKRMSTGIPLLRESLFD